MYGYAAEDPTTLMEVAFAGVMEREATIRKIIKLFLIKSSVRMKFRCCFMRVGIVKVLVGMREYTSAFSVFPCLASIGNKL